MSKPKKNLILITADQWRADTFSFLQNNHPVLTPHLDQLKDEGVWFSNAWADCPICMPQRATLLTGSTGSTLGLQGNFEHRTPVDPTKSLPWLLRTQGGYQCHAVGKTHVIPDRGRFGFDEVVVHPDDYVNFLEEKGYGGLYRGHGVGGNEVVPAPNPLPELLHSSHWITDKSIEFLYRRDPETPFFLWIIYEAPHPPFDPPAAYLDLYRNQPIPQPLAAPWPSGEEPFPFTQRRIAHNWDRVSPSWNEEIRRYYYAHQTFIDYQLGRFFGELKTRGLWDDTGIIFHSDHGEHLGDFGSYGKTTFLRGSGDVPIIIKPPLDKEVETGVTCKSPVQNADIPCTLADFAGMTMEDSGSRVDGTSLLPLLRNPEELGYKDRLIFGEYGGVNGSASVIGNDYRLIYYPQGGIRQVFPTFGDDSVVLPSTPETLPKREQTLVQWLSDRQSPIIIDGVFKKVEVPILDEIEIRKLRRKNPLAWRGPLRYGKGYGGGYA